MAALKCAQCGISVSRDITRSRPRQHLAESNRTFRRTYPTKAKHSTGIAAASGDHRHCQAEISFLITNRNRKGNHMTTNDTYVAVFLGSKTNPRMKAWMELPETERRAKEQEGIAAWKAWVEKHHAAVAVMGGPLGKTKKVSERGIEDVSNEM